MPVRAADGRVLGAVSISGTTVQTDIRRLEGLVPRLRQTVDRVSREASHWEFPVEGETEQTTSNANNHLYRNMDISCRCG